MAERIGDVSVSLPLYPGIPAEHLAAAADGLRASCRALVESSPPARAMAIVTVCVRRLPMLPTGFLASHRENRIAQSGALKDMFFVGRTSEVDVATLAPV
jgi:hypothetical protein